MPKMTAKYSAAVAALKKLNLATSGDQEMDYSRLGASGHMWDSHEQEWVNLANTPADPASPLIRIRVWAEKGKAESVAESVRWALAEEGPFDLVDQSHIYPCRPPKQNEERIYLSFLRRRGV